MFIGPLLKEHKAELDRLYDLAEQADREIASLSEKAKRARSKSYRTSLEDEIAQLQSARELLVEKIGEPSQRRRKRKGINTATLAGFGPTAMMARQHNDLILSSAIPA